MNPGDFRYPSESALSGDRNLTPGLTSLFLYGTVQYYHVHAINILKNITTFAYEKI